MPQVSIVIVCMNNIKQLFPCLDTIKEQTTVTYETFVVAYLFSNENKVLLKEKYPWVKVIESDEIRGFAENNNLALRQAIGEYCFVLNDDTLMNEPVIDRLVESFDHVPENTAIVSPRLVRLDGSTQFCGRPKKNWKYLILELLHLWNEKKPSQYIDGEGIFQSYNIIGAAFLIKTKLFKEMGWFDEYYFFCPEDVALSTMLNEKGYSCYVNADVSIVHLEGMSGKSMSIVQTATRPAAIYGSKQFYSRGNFFLSCFLSVLIFIITLVKFIIHKVAMLGNNYPTHYEIFSISELNILQTIFSKKTPKEIFTQYYARIKK